MPVNPALFLPVGMRDLLPDEVLERRRLASTFLSHVAMYGYDVVVPPAFELASVLSRGLSEEDMQSTIRFTLPETGDVAALRPDMTPQLARMISTHFADVPPPIRLAYEGTVVRLRKERARTHRQLAQAGLELAGEGGADGDLEVLEIAASVMPKLGIDAFVIDIAHAGIVRALLQDHPRSADLALALAVKDIAAVAELAALARGPEKGALAALPSLAGDVAVLREAERVLKGTRAQRAFEVFEALVMRLASESEIGAKLRIDVGEALGFAYYTGMMFRIYAEGPGEPLGGGGRYDELLARFGRPLPAVGFALNLDPIARAVNARFAERSMPFRIAALGLERAQVAALRRANVPVVVSPSLHHARGARATHLLSADTGRKGVVVLFRLDTDGQACEVPRCMGEVQPQNHDELVAFVVSSLHLSFA